MTKKIIISLAVIVAVAAGILYGKGLLSVHQGLTPPASLSKLVLEKPAKAAPDVGFADAHGMHYRLSSFKGRFVLLNLWATWCAPCVAELPALARLKGAAPGLVVLAIDWRDKPAVVTDFLKEHHVSSLGGYLDSDSVMMRSFGAYGLPMTVLIDPTGKVIAKAEGPAEWATPEAVAYFKRITGS